MEQNSELLKKRYHVSLVVSTGDDYPDSFEEISNLKASRLKRKGEQFTNQRGAKIAGKTFNENIYRFTFDDNFFNDCNYQNNCLEKTLNFIKGNENLLVALKKYPDAIILITGFYPEGDRPFFQLDRNLIKLIYELNIPITIDSY